MQEWLATNWPSIPLAVLLVPITIWLTLKLQPRRRPRYAYVTQVVQTKGHPGVTITFHGEPVENLHVLRLGFWNAGLVELRAEDLPAQHGPTIRFAEGVKVFSITSVESDPATGATLACGPDFNTLPIQFDYLNKGDGIKVEALYTTDAAKDRQVVLDGAIKGASISGVRWKKQDASAVVGPLVMGPLFAAVFGWLALEALSDGQQIVAGLAALAGLATAAVSSNVAWEAWALRCPGWLRDHLSQS